MFFLYTVSTCFFIKKKISFFLKSLLQRNGYYQTKPRNMSKWLKFCVWSKRSVHTQIPEPPMCDPRTARDIESAHLCMNITCKPL